MFTTTPGSPAPDMPIKTAARILEVSATPLRKGLASGVIPDLSLTTVDTLSRRPILTCVESATGEPVPVLRLGNWADAPDHPDAPPRAGLGYYHGMSDVDFIASVDRWWPASGRDLVLAAQSMLVANGSFVVGWADIDCVETIDADGLLHYRGRIVARLDNALDRTVKVVDPNSPNVESARSVVGLRVLGGSGGSITGLSGARGAEYDEYEDASAR